MPVAAARRSRSAKRKPARASLPIERATLANGLRVVVSPDRSAPVVAVAVFYDVGFRSEPEGRTGFAHLFEHLMFEGSTSLDKLEHARLVQGNGGVFNGSTRSDYTNYFEVLPSSALELALYLEADRMIQPRLTEETLENQISVVKEEIRVNVLNRPYGGFPWIDLPPVMFRTFNNAHNGYGSFVDLESATVDDAADFFRRYYAPGNAVLAIVGDVDAAAALRAVESHFGDVPKRPVPKLPRFSEPVPDGERRETKSDAMAPNPAMAVGYRVPDPIGSFDEFLAAVLLIDVLCEGESSRLYQRLVRTDQLVSHLGGMLGTFGDPFDVRDPTMLQVLAYYADVGRLDDVLAAIDDEVDRLAGDLGDDELDRVVTSMTSGWYRRLDDFTSRVLTLAAFEQQRGRAELVNELPALAAEVPAEAVRKAAATWLRPAQRAVLDVRPGGAR